MLVCQQTVSLSIKELTTDWVSDFNGPTLYFQEVFPLLNNWILKPAFLSVYAYKHTRQNTEKRLTDCILHFISNTAYKLPRCVYNLTRRKEQELIIIQIFHVLLFFLCKRKMHVTGLNLTYILIQNVMLECIEKLFWIYYKSTIKTSLIVYKTPNVLIVKCLNSQTFLNSQILHHNTLLHCIGLICHYNTYNKLLSFMLFYNTFLSILNLTNWTILRKRFWFNLI